MGGGWHRQRPPFFYRGMCLALSLAQQQGLTVPQPALANAEKAVLGGRRLKGGAGRGLRGGCGTRGQTRRAHMLAAERRFCRCAGQGSRTRRKKGEGEGEGEGAGASGAGGDFLLALSAAELWTHGGLQNIVFVHRGRQQAHTHPSEQIVDRLDWRHGIDCR